jgi:hypothetical protein
MWKLFIAILAISDTGNISSNLTVSDYANHTDCLNTARAMSSRTVQTNGTNQVTVIVNAQCNGDIVVPPPMPQQPLIGGGMRRW